MQNRTWLTWLTLASLLLTCPAVADSRLNQILEARPESDKARDVYRHPRETIAFSGIEPGMTVAEFSPGHGWYTRILVPLIGSNAKIIGLYYNPSMWAQIPGRYTPEMIEERIQNIHKFVPMVASIDANIEAIPHYLGSVDPKLHGTVDVVTLVRTLHNIMGVEEDGGYLSEALNDTYQLLKPGGWAIVVQHRAPEDADPKWANGYWGYVKTSAVKAAFERHGFEFVAQQETNANPEDQPTVGDYVWRLPPASQLLPSNQHLADTYLAIGESDRMTLKFRKPTQE